MTDPTALEDAAAVATDAVARRDLLVDADELARLLASSEPPLVLDVRWRLDRPDGRDDFAAGHIPGAVYVDLDGELSRHGAPEEGRHPLPSVDALQAAARRWGLRDGQAVVVADALDGLSAARAWWVLRDAGIASVRLLDGGLRAWTESGRALETGESPAREPGDVVLTAGRLPALTIDEAAAHPGVGSLVDARAGERYRGEVEPIDPRAGHIPGALSAPVADSIGPDGRFLRGDALRERFEAIGVSADAPVGVYCGSGVTAAAQAIALTLAGYEPVLYPGSWSAWSNRPDRPVATGASPDGSSTPAG